MSEGKDHPRQAERSVDDLLSELLQDDSADHWAYVHLAKSYAVRGDFDGARRVYDEMLERAEPGSWMRSLALNGLACCDLEVEQRDFTTRETRKTVGDELVRWGPRQVVTRDGTKYTRRHPYRGQPKRGW